MKILLIGFQRSGTTLMRHIIQGHPKIRKMFHEDFLLKKCNSKKRLYSHLMNNYKIDVDKQNWGEKVPLYPSARRISAKVYCERWNEYFGKDARIIHIVRHPYDVGLSVKKKYKGQTFSAALRIYKRTMPRIVSTLSEFKNCFTFKYEDLLLNPDEKIKGIFNFCGLDNYNYKNKLSKLPRERYHSIDPTRAFAYKQLKQKFTKDVSEVINVINEKVEGVEYN